MTDTTPAVVIRGEVTGSCARCGGPLTYEIAGTGISREGHWMTTPDFEAWVRGMVDWWMGLTSRGDVPGLHLVDDKVVCDACWQEWWQVQQAARQQFWGREETTHD